MKSLEQQALFEIVMAVGNGMELHAMLQASLSVMMRKLGCNIGAVACCRAEGLELVHAIPHRIKSAPSLLAICDILNADPLSDDALRLVALDRETFMLFDLPGYGALVLGKTGEVLSTSLLGALSLVASKLALACIACEQAHAVKEAQQRTQLLLDSTAEGIYGVDIAGNCTFANAAFLKSIGYDDASQIIGRNTHQLIHHSHADGTPYPAEDCPCYKASRNNQKIHVDNEVFWRRDGSSFPVEYWSYPIISDGKLEGAVVTCFDITQRRRAEQALQSSEARLQTLIQTIPDLVWMKDVDGVFLSCNPMLARYFGADPADVVGRTDYDFVDRALADSFREHDRRAILAGKPCINEEWLPCAADGSRTLMETIKAPTYNAEGKLIGVMGIARDITERKATEDQIRTLAFFDALTQLPNRRLLTDRLQHAIITSARSGHEGALLFLDLDNFKTLNDTLGHDKGDRLLQLVAQRLCGSIREGDTAARFGGDEFVVMLENLNEDRMAAAAQAEAIGEKILQVLNQPYDLAGHVYHSTPSIGITMFSDAAGSVDELMKRADMAMYHAKASGRNGLRFFDPQMQALINTRISVEHDLREGLKQRHFVLFYQAQVEDGGHISGAEVLVHWQHPQRGLLSPAEFIPVAEESGLILPLGNWVLRAACEQLAMWSAMPKLAHLSVAVNVSALQLRQPGFVAHVLEELARSGANPHKLKLELTETLLLDDIEGIIAKMLELKARGVGFSLDDFGTGYSSLTYLKRLPLDQLKIDQSFVRDVLQDSHDAAFARTIIALAQWLGLAVIAEGVETPEQQHFLASQGCFIYQGYLYGRPLPAHEFEQELLNA